MNNNKKAENRSRNEYRTEKRDGIEDFGIYQNERNGIEADFLIHHESYEPTLEMLADYQNVERSRIEDSGINDETVKHRKMNEKSKKSIQFHIYLHQTFTFHFSKRFTEPQLACLFQFFNGCINDYTGTWSMGQKATFIEYIDIEGKKLYDLGDVESFKENIKSITDIEFDVLSDFIVEKWNTNQNLDLLFELLAKN